MARQVLFGLAVATVSYFLRYAVRDMPPVIAWTGVFGGLVIAVLTFTPLAERFVLPISIIGVGGLLLFAGGMLFYERSISSNPTASGSPSPAQLPIPLTLRELFEADWPALPSYYMVSEINASDGSKKISVSWRLNGDFVARSKFLVLYFDSAVDPADVKQACEVIADQYVFFLKTADESVNITGQEPYDTSSTSMRDLVFSNRFFVYYDNPQFSLEQKGLLDGSYRRRNLSIQFRDGTYLATHVNDDSVALPSDPLTPNSIIMPLIEHPGLSFHFYTGASAVKLISRKKQLMSTRVQTP
jgi:hypothetical protein